MEVQIRNVQYQESIYSLVDHLTAHPESGKMLNYDWMVEKPAYVWVNLSYTDMIGSELDGEIEPNSYVLDLTTLFLSKIVISRSNLGDYLRKLTRQYIKLVGLSYDGVE